MRYKTSYFQDMLDRTRDQILESITDLVLGLGGKVCVRHYQEWDDYHDRYTFFEVNGDGYGVELFVDTVVYDPNEGISIFLRDSEDTYEPEWELSDLNASNALYLHEELEQIADFVKESGTDVVQEYDADYVPEEW